MRAGVIGAGLCGLTAAIRLARHGIAVDLFEAAPQAGGRTRSFFDPTVGYPVDNGPHLLSGAYRDTMALLDEAGASGMVNWQDSLALPLWESGRSHFTLRPNASLPLALALPLACQRLPGHDWNDIPALMRMAMQFRQTPPATMSVRDWCSELRLPLALVRDLLEPMCLGAMNEAPEQANAASFVRVLRDAFASHANARLGWFNRPLSEALVQPLTDLATRLGVRIHTGCRIRDLRTLDTGVELLTVREAHTLQAVILTQPLRSAMQLLGATHEVRTRRIRNVHMWFTDLPALTAPFIGGIGTTGQWFFDVSSQMPGIESKKGEGTLRHICAVISADKPGRDAAQLTRTLCNELANIMGRTDSPAPSHVRIVCEEHATVSVQQTLPDPSLPDGIIGAWEAPMAGEIPATIESAVRRGHRAAERCYLQYFR